MASYSASFPILQQQLLLTDWLTVSDDNGDNGFAQKLSRWNCFKLASKHPSGSRPSVSKILQPDDSAVQTDEDAFRSSSQLIPSSYTRTTSSTHDDDDDDRHERENCDKPYISINLTYFFWNWLSLTVQCTLHSRMAYSVYDAVFTYLESLVWLDEKLVFKWIGFDAETARWHKNLLW